MAIRSTRNFGRSSPISTVSIYSGAQPRGSSRGLDWGALPGGPTGGLDGRLDREAPLGGFYWGLDGRLDQGALAGGSMEGLRHGGGAVQCRPELPSGRREH